VVADNGSSPPLDASELNGERGLRMRIVREPRAGVIFARCAGILATEADLIVFVDDDNALDPDYLEQALRIAHASPHVAAFGGIARLRSDRPIADWMNPLIPYFGVRDYGSEPITSNDHNWGPWEPIGAGMAFRRDIALDFVRAVQTNPLAAKLGRNATSFICGEDSFLAKLAYPRGYSCSYQPSLRITHWIGANRFTAVNFAKTIEGIARAFVIYETVLGRPQPPRATFETIVELAARFRHRTRTKGFRAGAIEWFWDVGYFRQVRLLHRSEEWKNGPEILGRHSEL